MTIPSAARQGLANLLGERLSTKPDILRQHGRDEAYHRDMPPEMVAFPTSTEEVAQVAVICHAAGVPMIAFGAGTSLEGNVLALEGGVTIDLTLMNKVERIGVDDLDCTVQAGVTRLQLNEELRHTGLFFPLDPGANATIGGMSATRASGTNAVRYGTMREAVLALTVVTADGQVIRTGGRARKSSAGYDLTRLFVGSEGTLGIITEIVLRLHPIPEAVSAARCTFPDAVSAVTTVAQIIQSGIPIARVELADRAQMQAINAYSKLAYPVADTLFFECHGSPAGVAEQVEAIRALCEQNGGTGFESAVSPEERTRLWKARHDALYATTSSRPGSRGFITDVCVPISRLAECIGRTQALLATTDIPATIVGHVGDGNFHVIFAVAPGDPRELAAVHAISDQMVRLALELEGTCTGEHGIGFGKLDYMTLEHGDATIAVMRQIKQALDPRGLLNPGKVVPPAAAI
jgi:D-lactate dehydrogenase (cytochrome)